MGTTSYGSYQAFLIADGEGEVRIRRRSPGMLGPGEYCFRIVIRIPRVNRPLIAGEVTVDLPPDVDPDASAQIEAAGPLTLQEAEE